MTAHGAAGPGDPLQVRDLSVELGGREVLSEISFTVHPASLVGILGPNGAGKTTLLRALLGVVAHRGSVELTGRPAYVPQAGARGAVFPVDAQGVVLMGRYPSLGWGRRPRSADRRLALELLDRVGLADRARDSFGSLSGGQRQRVLVARALAQEARTLLLDEPLTGIDATSQDRLLAVFEEQRSAGSAILMTTHDLAQAARVCDSLVLLNRTLIAAGPVAAVLAPEALRLAYGAELVVLPDGRSALLDDAHHEHS